MGKSSSMRLIIIHIVCALVLCVCDSASSQSFIGAAPPQPISGVRFFAGLLNLSIPNYGMISEFALRSSDSGIGTAINQDVGENDGQNDGLWCQSANSGSNIGTWMQPDGGTVQTDTLATVYMVQAEGQVGLLRNGLLDESKGNNELEGLYQCMIPDENGDSQTLVLWMGTRDTFTNITAASLSQDLQFVPPSQPRDSNPPEYSLTFIVNDIPPTYVTCLKDDSVMDDADISREVVDAHYTGSGDSTSVRVTLTLKTRDAADYKCNMTFYKLRGVSATNESMIAPEDTVPAVTTALISISVTDLPTGLTAVRTEYNMVELSWSSPARNTPLVAGYEVFYTVFGSGSTQSGGTTTATSATLSIGLTLGNTYEFFVVAYSDAMNALPSAHSNTVTVELTIPEFNGPFNTVSTMNNIILSWPMPEYEPTGYTLTSVCSLLCCDVEFNPTETDLSASNMLANISGLPPGSECDFTLTVSYGDSINYQLNATTTTMLDVLITSATISTTLTSVIISWTTSSPSITLFEIRNTLNDATSVIIIDQATFELTDLSPNTSVRVTIQPMTVYGPAGPDITLVASTDALYESSSSQSTTIAMGIGLSVLLLVLACVIIALVIVVWRTQKAPSAKAANVTELQNTDSHAYNEAELTNTLEMTPCVAYGSATNKATPGTTDTGGSVYEAVDM